MSQSEYNRLIYQKPRQFTAWKCGFFDRAPSHSGSYTTGTGTWCSDCGERIYNIHFDGKQEKPWDYNLVDEVVEV